MRNSLKKRLFAHLYSILVISCTFALVQKKTVPGRFAPNPVRPLCRFAPIPVRPDLLINPKN